MNVDDKTMGIVGGIVLFFGMVVLYIQLTSGSGQPPQANQTPPASSSAPATASARSGDPETTDTTTFGGETAPGSPCGSTSGSCLAETELKSEGCEKNKTKEKLSRTLANPTTVGGCSTIEAQLQQGCAPGCQLDLSSLVIVPGKVEFTVDSERDALGRCIIKGKRPVRVSADCVTSFVQR